jgi:hypothetical protein
MIIDHVGLYFFPNSIAFRVIGRTAFPLYVFLVIQGYFFTSNFNKYAIRLFVVALLSEVPFDLFIHGSFMDFKSQNVIFQLLLVLIFIRVFDQTKNLAIKVLYTCCFCLLAHVLHLEFGFIGVPYGLIFYYSYQKKIGILLQTLLIVLVSLAFNFPDILQSFSFLSIAVLSFYETEKLAVKNKQKSFFQPIHKYYYLFYPLQFLAIMAIGLLLNM